MGLNSNNLNSTAFHNFLFHQSCHTASNWALAAATGSAVQGISNSFGNQTWLESKIQDSYDDFFPDCKHL